MKSKINTKIVQVLSTILILLTSNSFVFAYPPDNAAVLYYRSAYTYNLSSDNLSSEGSKEVNKYLKGEIEVNKDIMNYLEAHERAMKQFIDAGQGKYCDWGMDYSEGMGMKMPPLIEFRDLARITLAYAKIANEASDYKKAADLCFRVYKAGIHLGSTELAMCHLVSYAVSTNANDILKEILPNISNDPAMISRIRSEYLDMSSRFPKIKTTLISERNMLIQDMHLRDIDHLTNMFSDVLSQKQIEVIQQSGEEFIKKSFDYFTENYTSLISLYELPYPEAYEKIVQLEEKPKKDSKDNIYAQLASSLTPPVGRLLSGEIQFNTYNNAVMAALSLYVIQAEKGQLPDELPEGLPKDLFSGKDFKYEKNSDGFILKCQGKDLSKDKTYEYKFKVKN